MVEQSSLLRHPRLPLWVAGAIGLVLIINLGWKLAGPQASLPPQSISSESSISSEVAAEPASLTVYISGEVVEPGLVEVPMGSRVADALAAAGGVLRTANLGALNLARPLKDGDHLIVPEVSLPGAMPTSMSEEGVRINSATPAELEVLAGVGPTTAQKIVAYRETNGPFQQVEDLLDVPGIGEGKLAGFRNQVVVP